MLRIADYFSDFILKVLYLHFELLFLFAELVSGLSETVDHDVTGDFEKELKNAIFTP